MRQEFQQRRAEFHASSYLDAARGFQFNGAAAPQGFTMNPRHALAVQKLHVQNADDFVLVANCQFGIIREGPNHARFDPF